MKIALFSAFPHELAHVKKNGSSVRGRTHFPMFLRKQARAELLAVETGMGRSNLESAFASVQSEYRPDLVLSIGFGGALYYRACIGDLVFASKYLFLTREGIVEFPQLSSRNVSPRGRGPAENLFSELRKRISVSEGSFITIREWIEKKKLKTLVPAGTQFPLCERETLHLAKLACMNSIPFYAVRSVTDTLDDEIPEEFFHITGEDGSYRFSRAVGLLVSKPSLIPGGLRLGRNAARAARSLGEAVDAVMAIASSPAASVHRSVCASHPLP